MMKVQKKLAKRILLFSISLLMLQTSVDASPANNGQLQLEIDRIIESEKEQTQTDKTELEKRFPTLFSEQTQSTINTEEKQNKASMERLQQTLFRTETETNKTIRNVREGLFEEDYSAASVQSQMDKTDDNESTNAMNSIMLIVFTGLACLLCVGLYFMMRRMLS
ncbi:type VII secretion protein EssA [Virgibacillus sp. CM-4]|uniref:type VII secretion protein EssA n=1 Tax=Virgibacillus sp. CM-4 TaxID=1354277 RepID=UPI0009DBD145|nr:type VII secretion protein EssA [Virgibacillus sp. CM-4]